MTVALAVKFVVGLALLAVGAEVLVRGAVKIARSLGISSLIVGLTVVAFGTSSAELAVSMLSALRGNADVALGNVVGSNIVNIFLVLGVSACITPLVVSSKLVRVDAPIMLGAALLMTALGWDGRISRLDGAVLVAGLVAYIVFCVREAKRDPRAGDAAPKDAGLAKSAMLVVAGLVALILGSDWLVDGATTVAKAMGLSDLIVGLTVISVGTSLPEIAASLAAAVRGEKEMAVGNVVGSNIFNVLCVLGFSSLVAGVNVSSVALRFDIPVMLAASVICLPIFLSHYTVDRREGAILVFYYLGYVAFLILDAQAHDALPRFSGIMLAFVVPLTVIFLVFAAWKKAILPTRSDGS